MQSNYCYPALVVNMWLTRGACTVVQVVLEVKGEAQLTKLAQDLEAAGVRHKLWVEQPENFPTCLATAPYRKDDVQQHFKRLKLCKGS